MSKKKQMIPSTEVALDEATGRVGIGDFTKDAYIRFGGYVNTVRHLVNVNDGCKVSYRRLIYTALCFPKGKDIPSAELIGAVSKIHPHSTDGLHGLLNALTKGGSRVLPGGDVTHVDGVLTGTGNFGYTAIWDKDPTTSDGAAFRYTKARVSDKYLSIFGDLLSEVPWIESPVGAPEPAVLPLPLPLCLIMSEAVEGLGVAIRADYPNFSPQSLYAAWLHNDPTLLEPNVDITLDKSRSDLGGLWNNGKGTLTYSYRIERVRTEDGKSEGILFSGDTGVFTVSLKKLQPWINDGKVTVDNVSTVGKPMMLVSRVPGARGVTIEDIERVCREICYNTSVYNLNVTDGTTAYRIPLYAWLDYTIRNYMALVAKVNEKKIAATLQEIAIQGALPKVADYIMNRNPKADNREISTALGIPIEVVEGVMSKPIGHLRGNKDTTTRVRALKERLASLQAFNPEEFTRDIILQL